MRIRTIKPSFFTDEQVAALHPLTRLLYIGLWCAADCAGRLEYRPVRIKAEILPYDKHDVERALQDLHDAGFVRIYVAKQVHCIEVVDFLEHQRLSGKEATAESKLPAPTGLRRSRRTIPAEDGEASGKHRGSIGERKEGKGREGKGKEGEGSARAHEDLFDDGPPDPGSDTPSHPQAPVDLPVRLREVYREIAGVDGWEVATSAVLAARRLFGVPSEKQVRATYQTAADAGALHRPPEAWPDFRKRIARERNQERSGSTYDDRVDWSQES